MIILVLESEEHRLNFIRSTMERIPGISQILEASTLEHFFLLAEEHEPRAAIVEARLIYPERHSFYERINQYVPEIIVIDSFCQFAVSSFLEIRQVYNEPPSGEMLQQVIKGIMQRTYARNPKANLLTFKTRGSLVNIKKEEILFAEAERGKSVIHTRRGVFVVRSSLEQISRQLGEGFLRVHRSFIVNIKEISQVRSMHDRSYEIEFLNYHEKALMSRYKSQLYYDIVRKP